MSVSESWSTVPQSNLYFSAGVTRADTPSHLVSSPFSSTFIHRCPFNPSRQPFTTDLSLAIRWPSRGNEPGNPCDLVGCSTRLKGRESASRMPRRELRQPARQRWALERDSFLFDFILFRLFRCHSFSAHTEEHSATSLTKCSVSQISH